jgi:hypothetical protein
MEKYEGIRVYWDGKRMHYQNSKKTLDVPTGYGFPPVPFEGQLWYVL